MTITCYQVLPLGRILFSVSTHQSCLAVLSLLFMLMKSYYLLFRDFIVLRVQLFKNINYAHFQYSFFNQLVLFAQVENVNKLWNNKHTVHVNKLNQNQNKTNSCHIQIDPAFYCSVQRVSSLSDTRVNRKISCQ